MDFWPPLRRQRLADVTHGSLLTFAYQEQNYFALAVEPQANERLPALACLFPKHPAIENVGILNGSVLGGDDVCVMVIQGARAKVENPIATLLSEHGYIAAGSLSFIGDELAVICYVSNRNKAAYAIRDGRYLGEARPNEYFSEWAIEACDGQLYVKLATIKARPRS